VIAGVMTAPPTSCRGSSQEDAIASSADVVQLCLWSLNPAIAFRDLARGAHSLVLTSGTLAPMDTFASEVGSHTHPTLCVACEIPPLPPSCRCSLLSLLWTLIDSGYGMSSGDCSAAHASIQGPHDSPVCRGSWACRSLSCWRRRTSSTWTRKCGRAPSARAPTASRSSCAPCFYRGHKDIAYAVVDGSAEQPRAHWPGPERINTRALMQC